MTPARFAELLAAAKAKATALKETEVINGINATESLLAFNQPTEIDLTLLGISNENQTSVDEDEVVDILRDVLSNVSNGTAVDSRERGENTELSRVESNQVITGLP